MTAFSTKRLHEQRRQADLQRGRVGIDLHVELDAEPGLFQIEVALDVTQLLFERHELTGPGQPRPQRVGERQHEMPRAFRVGADERRDRVERVEDEMRLHLRLQRGGGRGAKLGELELRGQLLAERLERLHRRLVERRSVGRERHDRACRPVDQRERHDGCGTEWACRMAALAAQPERREQRASLGECREHGPDRPVARRMVVGAGADEGQNPLGVGDGDGAVAELLEQLVGDGARRGLGQASPQLGQRGGEELEHRGPAPRPADPGHDRIVHITDAILVPLRARYGPPARLEWHGEISGEEYALATYNPARRHDVTLFILDPAERLALIRKPQFAHGIWRPPGGGIKPGEDFAAGATREALEETGLPVTLERYLVDADARFTLGGTTLHWRTHVFLARTDAEELAPRDAAEIAGARWGSLEELDGPIRGRLLATGRALWRYRVALHDAAAAEITAPAPPAPRGST